MISGTTQRSGPTTVSTGGVNRQPVTVTPSQLLGPTASANVNLGNVQGTGGYNNPQPQMTTSNLLAPPVQGSPNQTPQFSPVNPGPSQNYYPSPQNPSNQNTALVQPVAGPGSPGTGQQGQWTSSNMQKPTDNKTPGYSQDNKPNLSTAQTSKNTSLSGPVNNQNGTVQRSATIQKSNGVKQSGPSLALSTSFKEKCEKTPKPTNSDKVIIPWDHSRQNYVYTDQAFDKLKPRVTKDQVKEVNPANLESRCSLRRSELESSFGVRNLFQ